MRAKVRLDFLDRIEARGLEFFEKVCDLDLEGIVATRKTSGLSGDREALAVLDQD
jgi:hypothetical protein